MTSTRWLGGRTLPVTARDAGRSDLPNVGFFRYLIFPHAEPASNNWASARVTWISGEVKILFFHDPPGEKIQTKS